MSFVFFCRVFLGHTDVAFLKVNASSFVSGRLGDRWGYKVRRSCSWLLVEAKSINSDSLSNPPQRIIAVGIFCTFVSLLISAFVSGSLWGLFVFQGFFLGLSQGLGMVCNDSLLC